MDDQTRAALGLLEIVTLSPEKLRATDFEPLRRAGLDDEAIADALQVCGIFNIYTRLADSLGFDIPPPAAFAKSAEMLLSRGYQ